MKKLLLFAILVLSIRLFSQEDIYVAPYGTDNPSYGYSWDYPFKTLSYAVQYSTSGNYSYSFNVYVAAGYYDENIILLEGKEYLNIVGSLFPPNYVSTTPYSVIRVNNGQQKGFHLKDSRNIMLNNFVIDMRYTS